MGQRKKSKGKLKNTCDEYKLRYTYQNLWETDSSAYRNMYTYKFLYLKKKEGKLTT